MHLTTSKHVRPRKRAPGPLSRLVHTERAFGSRGRFGRVGRLLFATQILNLSYLAHSIKYKALFSLTGCEQTFANMSSLYMHLKKVHRAKVESTKPAEHKKATAPKKPAAPKIPTEPKKSAEPKNPTEPKKSAAPKKPVVTKKSSAPKKSAPPKKSTVPKKLRAKKPKPKLGIEAANMLVVRIINFTYT